MRAGALFCYRRALVSPRRLDEALVVSSSSAHLVDKNEIAVLKIFKALIMNEF
jgi:hypothetical protein